MEVELVGGPKLWLCAVLMTAGLSVAPAHAADAPAVSPDGAMAMPAYTIPFSHLASPEAKAAFVESILHPYPTPVDGDIVKWRQEMDRVQALPKLAALKKGFAVTIDEKPIAGVSTATVFPADGKVRDDRIL